LKRTVPFYMDDIWAYKLLYVLFTKH